MTKISRTRTSFAAAVLVSFGILIAGCIGGDPTSSSRRTFYDKEPIVFITSYEALWDTAMIAVGELNWDVKYPDKENGIIKLMTSYVYNPSFGEYKRVYVEPTNEEAEKSKIKPYLRRISHYEKDSPINPLFVKEDMVVKLKSISQSETEIVIDYRLRPYYDYKVGYIGHMKSRGRVEKKLLERIQELLEGEG